MTLLKQDDGGVWISGPLVAAIVAGLFSILFAVYEFQNNRLWDDANAISELKVTSTNTNNEVSKLEGQLGSINQSLTTIMGSVQSAKDSIDAIKDQLNEVRKQASDLDQLLRPARPPAPPH